MASSNDSQPPLRFEDFVTMFHAERGGVVIGDLGGMLACAECGEEMVAFISSDLRGEIAR
jgi:hypothetical protein